MVHIFWWIVNHPEFPSHNNKLQFYFRIIHPKLKKALTLLGSSSNGINYRSASNIWSPDLVDLWVLLLSTVVTIGFNYCSIDNLVELQNIEEFARILKILCPKYLQQSTCKKCFQHRKLVSELDNRCLTELFRSKICNESKQHKECLVQNQLQAQF